MVRRYGNLWDKLVSLDNLELAYERAKKGKSRYTAVKLFDKNKEENLKKIQELLISKLFKTSPYLEKKVYEPKERTIYVLPFYPDRIVQHALINILEPIFLKLFICDTYACIKNRGIHRASTRTTKFVKRNRYCLKGDIRKFYPSINHAILYKLLCRKIKCKDTLWLLKEIIYSFEGGKNVPIGNLTSQWFGNFYMTILDKYVKDDLHISDYLRYCDDFCLFSNNKQELIRCSKLIRTFLKEELDLELSKLDLFPVSRGVDFLGYRHFGRYTLLRKRTAKKVKKRIPAVFEKYIKGKLSKLRTLSVLNSTLGWIQWADTYNFQQTTGIKEIISEVEKSVVQC